MRIWLINQYAGSPSHGMEFRHYYLARALNREGHDVTIFSGSYSHLYTHPPHCPKPFVEETIDDIRFIWVKVPKYANSAGAGRIVNMLVFFFRLFFAHPATFGFADEIMVSSPSLFPAVVGQKWAKKMGISWTFEIRDIWPLSLVLLSGKSPRHPLFLFMRWYERYAYRHANRIVSVLPGAPKYLAENGVDASRFAYLPNGISEEGSSGDASIPKSHATLIPDAKFVVGYAGTIGKANALDNLLAAARKLKDQPNIHFVIVGKGLEREFVRAEAKNLPNLTLLDPVNKSRIPDLLSRFDLCYIGWKKHPLYQYGVSANKLFDYLLAAKPIVHASDACNDPVRESGAGITVEPENPDALAKAISSLSLLPAKQLKEMGLRGKTFVLEHHTYTTIAKNYVQLLKNHDDNR